MKNVIQYTTDVKATLYICITLNLSLKNHNEENSLCFYCHYYVRL